MAVHAPERRCILTRESGDAAAMVRFVVAPDGLVVPDVDEKLPGRGLWLKATRDIGNEAVETNAFRKAARGEARVSPQLAGEVEALLARRCLDLIGFARRAGLAVAGFEKVRALVAKGRLGVLIASREAADDGRRKLAALVPDAPVVRLFAEADLARVFGRETVAHAAIEQGRIAREFLRETARLAGFRNESTQTASD